MRRRNILPDTLTPKQKRRIAGQRGAARSQWRHGFGSPLSPKDTGWAERMNSPKGKK